MRRGVLVMLAAVLSLAALIVVASAQERNGKDVLAYPHATDAVIVRWRSAPQVTTYESVDLFPALHIQRLKVKDVAKAITELSGNPDVLYAEPDYVVTTQDTTPNDPLFGQLWGMANIRAPAAWDITTGSAGVKVLSIDTGIDWNHPDLAVNVWTNPDEIAGNGLDDDANGYVDDVHGINVVLSPPTGNPMDDHFHGTHTSGTMVAVGNNGVGVVGVSWRGQVGACKFLNSGGSGYTSGAVLCLEYAVKEGFNLSNNSWGGGGESQALKDAIEAAYTQVDHLFVCAAGNSASSAPMYPCGYNSDSILCVMAIDSNDSRASFSNWGPLHVDIAAPGVNVLSTVLNGGYAAYNGTSMASPHAAGLVMLLRTVHPDWDALRIKWHIMGTGRQVSKLLGDSMTGAVIDAYAAVTRADTPPTPTPGPTMTPTITPTPGPTTTYAFGMDATAGRLQGKIENMYPASFNNGYVEFIERGYGAGREKPDDLEAVVYFTLNTRPRQLLKLRAITTPSTDGDAFRIMVRTSQGTFLVCTITDSAAPTECALEMPDGVRNETVAVTISDTSDAASFKALDTLYVDWMAFYGSY